MEAADAEERDEEEVVIFEDAGCTLVTDGDGGFLEPTKKKKKRDICM